MIKQPQQSKVRIFCGMYVLLYLFPRINNIVWCIDSSRRPGNYVSCISVDVDYSRTYSIVDLPNPRSAEFDLYLHILSSLHSDIVMVTGGFPSHRPNDTMYYQSSIVNDIIEPMMQRIIHPQL